MTDRYKIVGQGYVSRAKALRALRNGTSIIVIDSAGVPCVIEPKDVAKPVTKKRRVA